MENEENKNVVGSVTTQPKTDISGSKSYSFNFDEDEEYDLIPEGDYEVTLEAEQSLTKNGKECLRLKFRIRKDVEQKCQNRIIFENLWKDKDNPDWFEIKKLRRILKTQTKPQKDFNDVDECILYINGLNMRISVEKVTDDYRDGQEVNRIKYMSYAPSLVQTSDVATATVGATEDDDLPF